MQYRKKPVAIEAHQLPVPPADGSTNDAHENAVWAFLAWCQKVGFEPVPGMSPGSIVIQKLEGAMTATAGDWIIKGVKGEFYPCKPDIFDATYDAVSEGEYGDAYQGAREDAAIWKRRALEAEAKLRATYEAADIDLNAADFSDALMWLKEGKRVKRAGWNGAGQYVILIPGEHLARSAGYGFGEAIGEFTFGNVLALKNTQNIMQPGWVPSMGDLMATDWQVVSEQHHPESADS